MCKFSYGFLFLLLDKVSFQSLFDLDNFEYLIKQFNKLNIEIAKALLGDSEFTTQQLSSTISIFEEQINDAVYQINLLKKEINKERD